MNPNSTLFHYPISVMRSLSISLHGWLLGSRLVVGILLACTVDLMAQKTIVCYVSGNAGGYLPNFEFKHQGRILQTLTSGEAGVSEVSVINSDCIININRGFNESRSVRIPAGKEMAGIHVDVQHERWSIVVLSPPEIPKGVLDAFGLYPNKPANDGEPKPKEVFHSSGLSNLLSAVSENLTKQDVLAIYIENEQNCKYDPGLFEIRIANVLKDSITIVSRGAIEQILEEHKLQLTGLTTSQSESGSGMILAATHILTINCVPSTASCAVPIQVMDVNSGKIVVSQTLRCEDF
jgi:hypothetical protein